MVKKDTAVDFIALLEQELQLSARSIQSTIQLLDEGNTVPFISRYRKEATGNLNEVQIRAIQERHAYLKELEERRQTILQSIASQGQLTDSLQQAILACTTKTALEDLYLPYKPKRRTRAAIAREKGLEPLAELILSQPLEGNPDQAAAAYINVEKGVPDSESALDGARDIVAEKISENVEIRSFIRAIFAEEGMVISKVIPDQAKGPTKFEQYYDFKEKVKTIPSHRYLAIRRGEREGILDFHIEIDAASVLPRLYQLAHLAPRSPFKDQLILAIEDAYQRLIVPSVETDVRVDLKLASDRAAVDVFAENLRHLLLSAPLGGYGVIGIDPGLRTGCKCAVVDETGKYLDFKTIYLSQSDRERAEAAQILLNFIERYRPYAIGIGNGTAGRETEQFVRQLVKAHQKEVMIVQVNEAGASVYSASDVAREEFPDLDVTVRGAISIARRLQDPLAELVKIDPKSIGVGQYQHDVHQPLLQDQLHQVVESCVNHVGVDVNTASASLLAYVAGIGPSLAQKIVKHREAKGRFKSRHQLLDISGFGPRTFEQAAGFLRVKQGENPLDDSAVHPEHYSIVEKMAQYLQLPIQQLIGNSAVNQINLKSYVDDQVGLLTLNDIMAEIKKPGLDPRSSFEPPCFREDVQSLADLKPEMRLEGIVTNVTAFGAFVDIGVHQDGFIHISELSEQFIRHPSEVVTPGKRLTVEVLQVDLERKRIALTAKIGKKTARAEPIAPSKSQKSGNKPPQKGGFFTNPFSGLSG